MEFRELEIAGPLEIIPGRHRDDRGYLSEIFRLDRFQARAGHADFVQENQSFNARAGTLRGLHYQGGQGKLVRCTAGAVWDVVVDLRRRSASFGRWLAVELSAEAGNQLWIPAGFGHGFCTLAPDSVLCYRVTTYYDPVLEGGLHWSDPALAVAWPALAEAATLSARDAALPTLSAMPDGWSLAD